MMKCVSYLIVVMLLVAVSGCTGFGGGFAMGNGLQINQFAFKPASIKSGQSTLLTVEFQNMGSKNIEDVQMRLYGLPTGADEDVSWTGETIGSVYSGNIDDVIGVGGLRSANEDLQTQGQSRIVVFKMKSPIIELDGTEFTHRAYVRACYPYTTEAMAKIEVIGEDEWLLQEQTSSYSQHPIEMKQTAAPVQIVIESMQPVLSDEGVVLDIKISNGGGGVAFSPDMECSEVLGSGDNDEFDFDLNSLKIDGFGNCEIQGANDEGNYVSLANGEAQDVTVVCGEGTFSSDSPMQEMNVNFRLEYNYYIESEASVVIEGVPGDEVEFPKDDNSASDEKEDE